MTATAEWMSDGLCNYEGDPDDWYAGQTDHGEATRAEGMQRADNAKAICGRCVVKHQCLQVALNTREPWGIWGGLTAGERARFHNTGRLPDSPAPIRSGLTFSQTVALLREHGLDETRPIVPQIREIAPRIGISFTAARAAWDRHRKKLKAEGEATAA